METNLYRFRSMKALLGDFKELESQSIYFASLQELNDPMEGFRDTFWDGDEIAWRNLFRHYVQCLSHAFFSICIVQEEHVITWDMIPLHDVRPKELAEGIRSVLDEVLKDVFSHAEMGPYIRQVSERSHAVRRNELEFHLRNLHELAIPCIAGVLERRKLHPPFEGIEEAILRAKKRLSDASDSARRPPGFE